MDVSVSKPRVLHIDDSPDFRRSFKSILEKWGIVVLGHRDSREAAGLVPGQDFEVLVVDSSGFEYAEQARRQEDGGTLIVLSVHPESANFRADAFISKNDPAWRTKVLELMLEQVRAELEQVRAERDLYLEAIYASKRAQAPAETLPSFEDLARTTTNPVKVDL